MKPATQPVVLYSLNYDAAITAEVGEILANEAAWRAQRNAHLAAFIAPRPWITPTWQLEGLDRTV